MIGESWRNNWERVLPFLDFPPDVRRVIYTTNAIESLNSMLRKMVHYRGHFPTDEAVLKLLYLALKNADNHPATRPHLHRSSDTPHPPSGSAAGPPSSLPALPNAITG